MNYHCHHQPILFHTHHLYIMKEFYWFKLYDIVLKTYPWMPHLFKCEIFHLRPGGVSSTSIAQIVIVGNLAVWLECLMSTLAPCGKSKYLMKHSVLFQPTKMVHEMFTISEKTTLKFEQHKSSFFDILDFSSIMYYFLNSINVYVNYMSTVK